MVGRDNKSEALAIAALLENWADEIPRWDSEAGERWDTFAERRYRCETALVERLRRLPTCIIRVDEAGTQVDLILAGIRATSRTCLAEVCREWAAVVRRQASA